MITDSAISSSHHPAIRPWMVRNWQLHCRDFENLDFAKYLADSSVPLGDFENLNDSNYQNSAKQCFIKIQTFCKDCEIFRISQVSQNLCFVKLI